MISRIALLCALAAAAACTPAAQSGKRAADSLAALANAGPLVTTTKMREDLTQDLVSADRDLNRFEDSIYVYLGDTTSIAALRSVRTQWNEYRKSQCDAVRAVFAPGTMAPVAQLDCLVEVTDARRKFLTEQYNFVHPARIRAQRARP